MASSNTPEVWLRGPLPGIPPLLQPVGHALLQAREEVMELMNDFPEASLWNKPYGLASAGFHVQHITGVLDRLFTYARATALSENQLAQLRSEGQSDASLTVNSLVQAFHQQVDKALEQLRHVKEDTLPEYRGVGRAQLPSTVLGLYVHAAEHIMRHVGQLLVTVRMQKRKPE